MTEKVSCPSCAHLNAVEAAAVGRSTCERCGEQLEPEGLSGLATVGGKLEVTGAKPSAPRAAGARLTGTTEMHPVAEEKSEIEPPEPPEDTVGGSDTVGDLDSPNTDRRDDSTQSWQEGLLVADRFRIRRFIGKGGMGNVYLADDEILKRPIALKRVPQEIIFDADARDDLRQEANRLLDLAHENIVRVHTYYDGPTWPFFAMEYLQGPTLKTLLRGRRQEGRVFSPEEVRVTARQVCAGLEHAHTRNVIHRDLKPANLMLASPPKGALTDEDVIKITDFGISRVMADSTLRQTGRRSGTVPYMSPEQFRGEPPTVQSDIYSLACTLYELLSGRPPFYTGDVGYQILNLPPKALSGIPKPMADAILWALSKDSKDRFESVTEFVDALDGKVRRRSRLFTGQLVSVASKMLAGVLFVVFTIFLATRVFGPQSGPRPEPLRTNNPGRAPETSAAVQAERRLAEFKTGLKEQLGKQLPRRVGRDDGTVLPRDPPALSLTLSFPEGPEDPSDDVPGSSPGLAGSLLSRLSFLYTKTDDGGTQAQRVPGVPSGDKWNFSFLNLEEGSYKLEAFLEERGSGISETPLLEPSVFQVDLTAPVLEVKPADSRSFVDPVLRTTFDEEVEVVITSEPGSGEISHAYYQEVYGDREESEAKPIESTASWKITLPTPGLERRFRVHAVDPAGNTSEKVEVAFRRYRLDVVDLVVDVEGNVATLQGTLVYESEVSPTLEFFVNEKHVETNLIPLDVNPELPGEPQRELDFQVDVALDQVVNSIEVRYSWMNGPPKRLAHPRPMSRVMVKAPKIDLEPAEIRTRLDTVTLTGRVEPYFAGLDLKIENQGKSTSDVKLEPKGGGTFAEFSKVVPLHSPEQQDENLISVACYYNGSTLQLPTVPLSKAYRDEVPPTCRQVDYRFDSEDQLTVVITPSESLEELHARLGSAEGETLSSELLQADEDGIYRWVTEARQLPVSVSLVLKDLAGNETQWGTQITQRLERGGGKPAPVVMRQEPKIGSLFLRSDFLKEIGMDFVPLSTSERIEMGDAEVPEKAWRLFLKEKRFEEHGAGDESTDLPMRLGEYSPSLLLEFAEWFQEKAKDGYVYSLPTVDQWLCAFAGASPRAVAEKEITEWFAESFVAFRSYNYGTNTVYAKGTRPRNKTRTGLLDMESNLQEMVIQDGLPVVIGGYNQLSGSDEMLESCLRARNYNSLQGSFTGLRLCRKPSSE